MYRTTEHYRQTMTAAATNHTKEGRYRTWHGLVGHCTKHIPICQPPTSWPTAPAHLPYPTRTHLAVCVHFFQSILCVLPQFVHLSEEVSLCRRVRDTDSLHTHTHWGRRECLNTHTHWGRRECLNTHTLGEERVFEHTHTLGEKRVFEHTHTLGEKRVFEHTHTLGEKRVFEHTHTRWGRRECLNTHTLGEERVFEHRGKC